MYDNETQINIYITLNVGVNKKNVLQYFLEIKKY